MLVSLIIVLVVVTIILYIYCNKHKEHFDNINVPNEKICICMYYTDNIRSYSDLTATINQMYAAKHGYGFVKFMGRLSDRPPEWDKILYTLILLNDERYDYVFWIDSDAYFNDHTKKIQDRVKIDSQHDFYICKDVPVDIGILLLNSGTYLIRRSDWSKEFLLKVWTDKIADFYRNRKFYEQSTIQHLISKNFTIAQKTKVSSARQFNSNWLYNGILKWIVKDDYIIHLMGRPEKDRIESATKWLNNYYKNK